jgi:hypothetical protein
MKMRIERRRDGKKWTLICRGLTGNLTRRSSLDDLAVALREHGCSSLRFDYRYSLYPSSAGKLRTLDSMIRDTTQAISLLLKRNRRLPDVVVGRGLGARLALEALRPYPDVPLIMWTPILWLRTSLEIRYRLHEIRRKGFTTFDNMRIGARFVAALKDPTDAQVKSWIVPKRRHIIVYAKNDKVVPFRLVDEAVKLIKASSGEVNMIAAPGEHPHPGKDVSPQIAKIVEFVSDLK